MNNTTNEQRRELQRLTEPHDEDIDTSDIPKVGDFSGAVQGRFYRPIKQQITLRIDADLLEWFRAREREVPNAHICHVNPLPPQSGQLNPSTDG